MQSSNASFQAVIERVDRSIVAVLSGDFGDAGIQRPDIGSGVLVRLGGREFVFTAAHNVMVDGEPRLEPWITVVGIHNLPGGLHTVGRLGGGALGVFIAGKPDARGKVEPDVAVLEPGPNALLRSDRAPITAAEMGFIPPNTPATVLVAGYPCSDADAGAPKVPAEGD